MNQNHSICIEGEYTSASCGNVTQITLYLFQIVFTIHLCGMKIRNENEILLKREQETLKLGSH